MTVQEPHPTSRPGPGATGPRRTPRGRSGTTMAVVPVALIGALTLVLAACGSSSNPSSTTAASSAATTTPSASATTAASGAAATAGTAATVKVATTASFGKILVNSSGMALYTFGPDHGGSLSTCTGACIQAWPPLTVPAGTTPHAGAGVTGTLSTARQSNGELQVTYNGNLLYTFLSDSSPGQVTGNGVAGFSVAKVAASSTPSPAPTTTAAKSSGGYQY